MPDNFVIRLFYFIFVLNSITMDESQIRKLKRLGISTTQTTIDIFDNLLELAIFMYEELEIKEEDRMRIEINRIVKKPSN